MRHNVMGRRLSRSTKQRKALFRSLTTELFRHNRIKTTEAKAKEVRGLVDRIITWGKRGDSHARRLTVRKVRSRTVVKKVFDELGPRYQSRPGGYTRILKVGHRHGDNAPMVILELVDQE